MVIIRSMAGEKDKALRSKSGDGSNHSYEPKKGGDGLCARPSGPLVVANAGKIDMTCSRSFRPRNQLWKLLGDQMWRLIFTVVLVALVLITLRVYKNKGTVTHTDKIVFNTIITVLNLALGLNFLEAFKDMAKVLRWRVLANRKSSVRETDLILGGESLMNLVTLMRESMRKPLTLTVCICWIALNLLAQASVALIGLNYSMDNGQNSRSIITSRGNVLVPRVDCYYNNGTCTTDPNEPPEIAQNEAHSYGEITPGQNACLYTTDDDIFNAHQDCDYFINRNQQEFAYRFMEYNPDQGGGSYPYLTYRLIKASAGDCYQYAPGTPHDVASHDGPQSVRVWPYTNGTYNGTISIPIADTAFDSTTYAYLGDLEPQNALAQACGPRCIYLYAFRSGGPVTKRDEAVFQCPITISKVTNATDPAHVVPDDTARTRIVLGILRGTGSSFDYILLGTFSLWQMHVQDPFGHAMPCRICT
ncbi:MAG: hypothetical protein Q9212_004785 [Teloschistes hypoglaucus]